MFPLVRINWIPRLLCIKFVAWFVACIDNICYMRVIPSDDNSFFISFFRFFPWLDGDRWWWVVVTVSRLHCESESFKMDLILDINSWLYPMELGECSSMIFLYIKIYINLRIIMDIINNRLNINNFINNFKNN